MTQIQPSVLMNLEAEAALLGAMMIDNRLIDRVLDRCEPGHFADALHGRIFETMIRQQALGRQATPVTLKPLLESDPALQEIGGPGYLAKLTANSAGLLATDDFADQVRELAKMRQMRERVVEALRQIDSGGAEPAKIAAELEAAAWAANDETQAISEHSFADTIQMVLDRQAQIDAGVLESGMMCATIGDMNTITAGLQPGWLQIVAGRPAMGKTAWATSAAVGYAMNGHGVGFVSLEMDSLALGQRLAADITHWIGKPVAYPAIREGRLTKEDRDNVLMARDRLDRLPLQLIDVSRMSLGRVAGAIRRMKRKMAAQGRALNIVFIDYLTLIDPDNPSRNRAADVGTISRGLKALAKQEQIAIVALAQLNRAVETREDKRPTLADLRDSGEIEQDADIVIFLYRDEYYLKLSQPDPDQADKFAKWQAAMDQAQGRIEFIAAKVRAGQAQTLKGFFFGQNQAVRGSDFYKGAH